MKNKQMLIIIIALCVVMVVSISVAVWAIFFRNAEPQQPDETGGVLPPDYPPQSTEPNQTPIPDDPGGEIPTPEGGGAVNITYRENIKIDLSDKVASLYYSNPLRSNQNVAIAVMIGDEIIMKSALITPGNKIESLPLSEGAEDKLSVGGYDATLIIYCYNPESGEKAMVDSKASVVLTVSE